MKTKNLFIAITAIGLVLMGCTGRQLTNTPKADNNKVAEMQKSKDAKAETEKQTAASDKTKDARANTLPVATYDRLPSNLISKIHFKNSSVVFDVYENNPYNNLNCGKVYNKTKNLGNCYGSIKGKQIKDFVENFLTLPYNPKIKETDPVDSIATYGYAGDFGNMRWFCISYVSEIYANHQWSASENTIMILDSLGHQKNVIKNVGTNINLCSMTYDGKYLAIDFGFDSESDYILKKGYKVYDLEQSNKLVYDQIDPEASACIYSDLLFITKEYYKENTRFIDLNIYDLYNGFKYSGTFKADDIDFSRIDKEGIGKKLDNKQKFLFNKDFKVEKSNLL